MPKKDIRSRRAQGSRRIKPPSHAALAESTESSHPIFSLHYLDPDYCISKCERDEKVALIDKLRELSQLTWRQLELASRHGLGYEFITRSAIRGRVPEHFTEDVDRFIAFRFDGMKPMVGHREKEIFHLIWVDRGFSLYDH